MTILTGILCEDGVVIGADSASTFVKPQQDRRQPTISQQSRKLFTIEDQVLMAGSGSVGLSQRFKDVIEDFYDDGHIDSQPTVDIGRGLSSHAIRDLNQTGLNPTANFGALVGCTDGTTFDLIEFAISDFQPQILTDDLWYVSMGSGQHIVDPFFGLMREIFWGHSPPRLRQAIFVTHWALDHAVNVNPGGISRPISIGVIEQQDSEDEYQAHLLDEDSLAEHEEHVSGAKDHLEEYWDEISTTEEVPVPEADATAE